MKIYDYNGRKNLCGKTVRNLRKKNKLSQADLAARMQLAGILLERDSVSRMESGTRFIADYELKVLSDIFGVPIADLFE